MVRFEPSPMRVLLKQSDELVDKKSIIVIPDAAKDNECARYGVVMAYGKIDPEIVPWTLALGDLVLFHIHEAVKVVVDGDEFYLTGIDGVLGRLNPKD